MTLGTRVAVMRDGTLQQVDTPQRLYREPVNLFVAAFIGSPSMNLVEAELGEDTAEFAGFRLPLSAARRPEGVGARTVILGIRPQDFEDVRAAPDDRPVIEVEAAVVEELGSATHVLFTIEAPPVAMSAARPLSRISGVLVLLRTSRSCAARSSSEALFGGSDRMTATACAVTSALLSESARDTGATQAAGSSLRRTAVGVDDENAAAIA